MRWLLKIIYLLVAGVVPPAQGWTAEAWYGDVVAAAQMD